MSCITLGAWNRTGIENFTPQSDSQAIDWDELHDKIQEILAKQTERLLAEIPGLHWESGRVSGGIISLSTHRTYYHLDGDDYDPIIIGLTFVKSGPIVRISGDISGDESGFLYFWDERCKLSVAADAMSVLEASSEIAERLSSQDEVIAQAVSERHPRAMPR